MTSNNEVQRSEIIDERLAVLQKWGLRIIIYALALIVLGLAFGRTWMIWFPVSIAVLIATVLSPPTAWMRDRGMPAAAAAGISMIAFIGFVGLVFSILIPQVVDEAPEIANRAAAGLSEVQTWLIDGPMGIDQGQITRMIETTQNWLKDSALDISTEVLSTLGAATGFIVNFVLIMILTFLFVKDGYRFLPWVEKMGGVGGAGTHLRELLGRTWGTLGGFIRTQALVSFIDAILIGVGLLIVDVPLAVPLAILVFFGGFIPIVGAFATGALAVLVTLVTNGLQDAIIVLIIIVVVQQIEGNVLSPILQGKSMNLHPAVVLLAVTAGGSMFGITGAFLAVPVAAAVAELFRFINERIDEEWQARRGEKPPVEESATSDETAAIEAEPNER